MSAFHIPGLACPCGSPDLVMGAPGTDAEYAAGIQIVAAVRSRAWCSPECARARGGYVAVAAETTKACRAKGA